ncbi:MAG: alginate lyase family protein [Halanaerobiales bacterium]
MDDSILLENLQNVADVKQFFPEKLNKLLSELDLNDKFLEPVKNARDKGNYIEAGKKLLDYYKSSEKASFLRKKPGARENKIYDKDKEIIEEAEGILDDVFTNQGVSGKMRIKDNGLYDWSYYGPKNDKEWFKFNNRLGALTTLLRAWEITGEKKYVRKFNHIILDWMISNPITEKSRKDSFAQTPWHQLDTGIRAGKWATLFHGFQHSPLFTDAARILMLEGVPRHAQYIQKHHRRNHNFITMQMNGLCRLGLLFPEFKAADKWVQMVKDVLTEEICEQVYPDGVQKELTAEYHMTALKRFQNVADELKKAGEKVDKEYHNWLEKMWNYIAYVLRPNGKIPLNNDSNSSNKQKRIIKMAKRYDRSDWLYITTNGQQGKSPAGLPTRIFPWAGQLVMRNGWEQDAHWAFFDIGPWGLGHQHNDKLHLSVSAYGRDLLVDSGRFAYQGEVAEKFRNPYARHSRGHNVILIDGKGQGPDPKEVEDQLEEENYQLNDRFDFAFSSFDNFEVEGDIVHNRSVFYLKNNFWVVVDSINPDGSRKISPLWHFHPDCKVEQEGNIVKTNNMGNLLIQPLGDIEWDLSIVKGQSKPVIQGWYSKQYNQYEPAACAVYEANIDKETVFAWILKSGRVDINRINGSINVIEDKHVLLEVEQQEKSWSLQIPLKNGSKKAKVL